MIKNRLNLESYPDGVVNIYSVAAGQPETLTLKEKLHFRKRTVGNQRYFQGMQVGVTIQAVIRCPARPGISSQDIAELPNGQQYQIRQVQDIENSNPPSMDLALEEVLTKFTVGAP